MKKKADKYTSADVRYTMALNVLRRVADSVRSAPFFSTMVDETTDASKVVFCCRWVDVGLEAHEDFIGLHEAESTQASALFRIIRDVLTRLNVSITRMRGQCYDGASSMAKRVGRAQSSLHTLLWALP